MRFCSNLAVGVAIATFLICPVVGQNLAYVQHIEVRGDASAIEIEIKTSGDVSPNTQAITGPDRILIDFPGALPTTELHGLDVNRGALKRVRSGLFFDNPPITRVVLDLTGPQEYKISRTQNGVIVRLGGGGVAEPAEISKVPAPRVGGAHLETVSRVSTPFRGGNVPPAPQGNPAPALPSTPAKPLMSVAFQNGLLSIHSDGATLAQVLFEVQRQTQAEIAIPAGAEQEQVVAELGPAPIRDVLASLLNGSPYNFIFVGDEQGQSLEKVILTRRDNF